MISTANDTTVQVRSCENGSMSRFCTMRQSDTRRNTASTVAMEWPTRTRHASRNSTVTSAHAAMRSKAEAMGMLATVHTRQPARERMRAPEQPSASRRAGTRFFQIPSEAPRGLCPKPIRAPTSTAMEPRTPPPHCAPRLSRRRYISSSGLGRCDLSTKVTPPLPCTKNHTMTRQII